MTNHINQPRPQERNVWVLFVHRGEKKTKKQAQLRILVIRTFTSTCTQEPADVRVHLDPVLFTQVSIFLMSFARVKMF